MPLDFESRFEPIDESFESRFEPIEAEPTGAPETKPFESPYARKIRAGISAPERQLGRVFQPAVPVRVPQWQDIERELPPDMKAYYGDKIKNALSISAALDIPPSQSFDLHDNFTEKYREKNLWGKAQGSFKAGIGDVYSTMGNTMKWLGASDESAEVYTDFGERLRMAYIPPFDQSEFTYKKVSDPEWWATTGARSVPFMLSLVPAAVIGAYGGVAVAGAAGFGAFGTTVLGAIGGAALSRPIESAFEAGGVYEEAIARGMTEEEADKAANNVFKGNMALTGMDAAQFALAFTPLKVLGKSASKSLALRILATTGKFAAVGLSEAGEERYQETISVKALGDDVSFFDLKDPRLNEASAIGAIFGMGLGGAGSVWTGLTNHVINTMPEGVKAEYDTQKLGGKTDLQALDAVAATPEGEAHVTAAIEQLKAASEDISKPIITEPIAAEPIAEPAPREGESKADLTDRAMFELSMEGIELEDMTAEVIQAKVESYEQAAIKPTTPVAETATPEAGVPPEQATEGIVGGEGDIFEAVSQQLRDIYPIGTAETKIQAQSALWDSTFKIMAQRAGVSPEELYQRYKPTIEREVEKKVAVNEDGTLNLTNSQKKTLETVRYEVEQGEAGYRLFREFDPAASYEMTSDMEKVIGIPSTFPDYFKNKGYTKKETLIAIDKALTGKKLGVRQQTIVQDLNSSMRYRNAEGWRGFRTREEWKEYRKARMVELGKVAPPLSDEQINEMSAMSDEEFIQYEQSAFHGTPHKFDKFTLDHIGTGEGAQAYGWGLYFASNEAVGRWYQELLSRTTLDDAPITEALEKKIGNKPPYGMFTHLNVGRFVTDALQRNKNKHLKTLAIEARSIADDYEKKGQQPGYVQEMRLVADVLEGKYGEVKRSARLYKVNLTPEQDEYLDWDKPLSEQSEKVKKAINHIASVVSAYQDFKDYDSSEHLALAALQGEHPRDKSYQPTGLEIYSDLADVLGGSEQAASLYLKSIGIPGIKYLEGISRTKGAGHYNFVIFDEELIQIEAYEQAARGRITFGPEGVNITLLKNADMTTFLHETGHFYLKILGDLGQAENAPADLKADLKTVLDWLKVESVDKLETKHHEKFARGFEKYLAEGKAPSEGLKAAFEQFKTWLIEVYKNLKALNVKLTPEVRAVMDRMLATDEEIAAQAAEVKKVTAQAAEVKKVTAQAARVEKAGLKAETPETIKQRIARTTGIKQIVDLIREDVALNAAWKKAEQNARTAFKEGKKGEAAKWREKMAEIVNEVREKAAEKIAGIQTEKQKMAARRKQINDIVEYLGLTDSQVKKLIKKDFRLMTDNEYKRFKDNLLIRAGEMQEKTFEKARVREAIDSKRLEKAENYRRVLGYPTVDGMTTEQLRDFADTLEQFQDGDVFLTERELETVDKTDLKGIKTWREAKEALAKEIGTPLESLDTIKPTAFDMLRWDTALAERNPFYRLLVETTTKSLMNAEARYHEVENRVYELAKKSEKSRGLTLTERLIPQDKQIFEYLETPVGMKEALAEKMTPEQVDLANYMAEFYGKALEHLIKTKALEKGRQDYMVHIRRSFLETLKGDGIGKAVLDIFKNSQQDAMVFNILDDDTGNILTPDKFFRFSMRRTGALEPTQNVVKAFLTYAKTFEKKVSLDEISAKLDIYTQSLTPRTYTPRGLEMDRSLKKFVNRYINNKKGRQISFDSFIKQGGQIDLSIRALRTFTTLIDLGLNIRVGVASFIGERVGNFELLGVKKLALGEKRVHTKKGRAIIAKYEHFIGRSLWEEFTAPGKEITERITTGLFGFFHAATVAANEVFLLGAITESEYNNGEINADRLAALKIEMGRWRVVPGTKSLVGSTSAGGAAVQYKSWAVVMARTTIKDITTLMSDLKNKPMGEALTTREAQELYRAIGLITVVLVVSGVGDDERDKSFTGQLMRRIRSESLSILSALSPDMWLHTPRIIGFISQLGKNLTSLVLLEEYKTKPGLKGVEGLKRQFTPGVVRELTGESKQQRGDGKRR